MKPTLNRHYLTYVITFGKTAGLGFLIGGVLILPITRLVPDKSHLLVPADLFHGLLIICSKASCDAAVGFYFEKLSSKTMMEEVTL